MSRMEIDLENMMRDVLMGRDTEEPPSPTQVWIPSQDAETETEDDAKDGTKEV